MKKMTLTQLREKANKIKRGFIGATIAAGSVITVATAILAGSPVVSNAVEKNEIAQNRVEFINGYFEPTSYTEKGNTVIDLTDGSYILYEKDYDTWTFQPVEMLDWSIEDLDKNEVENIVEKYMETKNNMSDEDTKNITTTKIEHNEKEDILKIEFSDGSYLIADNNTAQYEFFPSELNGSWSYYSNDKIDLIKQVITYLEYKNLPENVGFNLYDYTLDK